MIRNRSIYYFLGIIIAVAIILWFRGMIKETPSTSSVPLPVQQPPSPVVSLPENAVAELPGQSVEPTRKVEAVSSSVPDDHDRVEAVRSGTNLLKVAGREFSVLFESSDVSDSLRNSILNDIELNLSHFTNVTLRDVSDEPQDPGQIYKETVGYILDEGKQKRLFPEPLEKFFGGVVLRDGIYNVVVHKDLIREYEKAIAFRDRHPEMFKKAEAFLNSLRNSEELREMAADAEKSKSLFFFDKQPSPGVDFSRQLKGLMSIDVRDPSVLDFRVTSMRDKNVVIFKTLMRSKDGAEHEFMEKDIPQFIYIDGEWRIYVPRLP